jgi:hypothetical protein
MARSLLQRRSKDIAAFLGFAAFLFVGYCAWYFVVSAFVATGNGPIKWAAGWEALQQFLLLQD